MPKVMNRKEITLPEAKQVLDSLENPNPFQMRTSEYVNKFSKLDSVKASELVDRLINEFEIDRKDAIEVVNCMPGSIEELRTFFSTGRKRLIVTAKLESILKILDEHR